MINVIRDNWSGADAENFIKAIEKEIKHVETKIIDYDRKISSTLEASYTEFTRFQENNKV